MWKQILAALLAWFNKPKPPEPPPPEPPKPFPCPEGYVWSPTGGPHGTSGCIPIQAPSDPPKPPDPPANPTCGKPTSLKLGIYNVVKKDRGARIVFDTSPMVDGVKAPEGCGPYYDETYGQVLATQDGPGFKGDPVERASSNPNLLVIATNYEADWDGDRYKLAGNYILRVTYPWFKVWRAQAFTINDKGIPSGYGTNAQSYDEPK
jgi:hypothetical protein